MVTCQTQIIDLTQKIDRIFCYKKNIYITYRMLYKFEVDRSNSFIDIVHTIREKSVSRKTRLKFRVQFTEAYRIFIGFVC